MPNWCSNNITICHNDNEKLKALYENIKKWSKKTYHDNGFDYPKCGSYWLGNIVGNAGLSEWNNERNDFVPNIRCRGSLNDLSYEDGHIHIRTETAWEPMLLMWDKLREKYLPDAEIWFNAEESGCGLYATNDPDIIGTFYVDVWEPPEEFADEESMYEVDADCVVQFLQKVLKTEESDIKKLLEMSDEMFDSGDVEQWYSIHMWESAEITDFE